MFKSHIIQSPYFNKDRAYFERNKIRFNKMGGQHINNIEGIIRLKQKKAEQKEQLQEDKKKIDLINIDLIKDSSLNNKTKLNNETKEDVIEIHTKVTKLKAEIEAEEQYDEMLRQEAIKQEAIRQEAIRQEFIKQEADQKLFLDNLLVNIDLLIIILEDDIDICEEMISIWETIKSKPDDIKNRTDEILEKLKQAKIIRFKVDELIYNWGYIDFKSPELELPYTKEVLGDREKQLQFFDQEMDSLFSYAAGIAEGLYDEGLELRKSIKKSKLDDYFKKAYESNEISKKIMDHNSVINKIRNIEYILSLLNIFNEKLRSACIEYTEQKYTDIENLFKEFNEIERNHDMNRFQSTFKINQSTFKKKEIIKSIIKKIYDHIGLNISNVTYPIITATDYIYNTYNKHSHEYSLHDIIRYCIYSIVYDVKIDITRIISNIIKKGERFSLGKEVPAIDYNTLKEIWVYINDPDYIGNNISAGLIVYNKEIHTNNLTKIKIHNSIRVTSYGKEFDKDSNTMFPKGAIGRKDINESTFDLFNTIKSGGIREFCEETFIDQKFLESILNKDKIDFNTLPVRVINKKENTVTNYNNFLSIPNLTYLNNLVNFKDAMTSENKPQLIFYFIIGISNEYYNELTTEIIKNIAEEKNKIVSKIEEYRKVNPEIKTMDIIKEISSGTDSLSTKSYESHTIYIQKYLKYKAKYLALKKLK